MIEFEIANESHAKDLVKIYNYYVENTTVSYETEAVSVSDFAKRIMQTSAKYPYIIAVENGKILGYAYASSYRTRAAFNWGCELSVYVDKNARANGVGTKLLGKLIAILKAMNFTVLYSFIDYPNDSSMALHRKFNFNEVGTLTRTGYKHEKWLDMMILDLQIGDFNAPKSIDTNWQKYL